MSKLQFFSLKTFIIFNLLVKVAEIILFLNLRLLHNMWNRGLFEILQHFLLISKMLHLLFVLLVVEFSHWDKLFLWTLLTNFEIVCLVVQGGKIQITIATNMLVFLWSLYPYGHQWLLFTNVCTIWLAKQFLSCRRRNLVL